MNEMEFNEDSDSVRMLECESIRAASGSAKNPPGTNVGKQPPPMNNSFASLPMMGEQATDQLEKCGKWLASIPRDDIAVLRQTVEFREFLRAFERLGHAHLRVVVNSQASVVPTEMIEDKKTESCTFRSNGSIIQESILRARGESTNSATAIPRKLDASDDDSAKGGNRCSDTLSVEDTRRIPVEQRGNDLTCNGNNFLRFTDDILLRILEFLRSKCLIQTSLTCSRFHQLVRKSATQRTYDIATARQLGNVMQLLRAKEQIHYLDSDDEDDLRGNEGSKGEDAMMDSTDTHDELKNNYCNVPVPTLLPGKKVIVTNAGDPEYNGVYYCTDCNGNGFVFTKPRFSSQQTVSQRRASVQSPMEDMVFDEETNPRQQNRIVGAIQRAGRLPLVNPRNNNPNNGGNINNGDDEDRFQPRRPIDRQDNQQVIVTPNNLRRSERFAEESFQSGLPLRCVIAKAYSNHDILWYMSKEIELAEDNSAGRASTTTKKQRQRLFSFYAPLMLSGNSPPDLAMYPSQTSALRLQSQAWSSLGGPNNGIEPPTLEVIDVGGFHV